MPQAYTNDHSPSVLQTYTWRDANNSAGYLLPYLRPYMSILDVGCGPGSITIDLARKVPQGHVVGVEYVSDPLDGARSLASSEGVANVKFEVGDIHDLPFPENTFDVVHAHQVLQHIADPVQAFKEMRRVLKQGGIVAVQETIDSTRYPESEGLEAWSDLQDRMRQTKGNRLKAGTQLHVWARKAGFPVENMKKSTGSWCFSTPNEREYWGGAMEERVRSSGLAATAVREGLVSEKDLQQMAAAWRTWVEDEDGVLGTPDEELWPDVTSFPDYKATSPKWKRPDTSIVPDLVPAGVELLEALLEYDPAHRLSAKQACIHPLLPEGQLILLGPSQAQRSSIKQPEILRLTDSNHVIELHLMSMP